MLDIIGWVVWAAVLILALMLSYGLSQARTVTRGTLFLICALWMELGAFLLKPEWHKLHLVWILPLTVLAMALYSYSLNWHLARSIETH
jgi:hypothetical protein